MQAAKATTQLADAADQLADSVMANHVDLSAQKVCGCCKMLDEHY
jgi:hypothetical protein